MSFVVAMMLMWFVGGVLVAAVLAICIAEGRPRQRASERLGAERAPQPMPGAATVIDQEPGKPPKRQPGWAT